jgi:hypothetical protein
VVIESIGFRMSLTALYSQPDEVISILAVVIHRAYETGCSSTATQLRQPVSNRDRYPDGRRSGLGDKAPRRVERRQLTAALSQNRTSASQLIRLPVLGVDHTRAVSGQTDPAMNSSPA